MSEQAEQITDTLDRAKALGYKDPEEWKGDPPPNGFQSPEEFLSQNTSMREQLDQIRSQNAEMLATNERMQATFGDYQKFHEETVQKAAASGYERARRELVNQQTTAISEADGERFQQLERQKENLVRQEQEQREEKVKEAQEREITAIRQAWEAQNPWYKSNFQAHATAEKAMDFVISQNPGIGASEALEEMTKLVKEQHPDLDSTQSIPSLESGNRKVSGTRGPAKSYANLPPDAKAKCDQWVADGLTTQERYLEDYFQYDE